MSTARIRYRFGPAVRSALLVMACLVAARVTAYDAEPPTGTDLSGDWALNQELSEDPARKDPRLVKRRPASDEDTGLPADTFAPEPRQDGLYGPATLRIRQSGRRVEMLSENETRRFDAGSESTVSTPGGRLADSRVGWDGRSFVVDRRVPKGPRLLETYRLLPATDQLEVKLKWSGRGGPLSGKSIRRVYDRARIEPAPAAEGPMPAIGVGPPEPAGS